MVLCVESPWVLGSALLGWVVSKDRKQAVLINYAMHLMGYERERRFSVPALSSRCFLNQLSRQQKLILEEKILTNCSDGLIIGEVEKCGKGLFATKHFLKGDYLCVYVGTMMSNREYTRLYGEASSERCYTFHVQHDSSWLVIDATDRQDSVARMANHSWKRYNAAMNRQVVRGEPYLVMFAFKDIKPGHEIRYNYGDEVVAESAHKYEWLREIVEYN